MHHIDVHLEQASNQTIHLFPLSPQYIKPMLPMLRKNFWFLTSFFTPHIHTAGLILTLSFHCYLLHLCPSHLHLGSSHSLLATLLLLTSSLSLSYHWGARVSPIVKVLITASKTQKAGFQGLLWLHTQLLCSLLLSQTSLSNRSGCYCAHLSHSQGMYMTQHPFLTSLQGFPQLSPLSISYS